MLISVVIPAYNEEKHLEACLNSLRNQVRLPDEILVVDNNSTDGTVAFALKYGAKVITERRQGIWAAASTGYDNAPWRYRRTLRRGQRSSSRLDLHHCQTQKIAEAS